jgi:hypothetical protein
MSSQQEPEKQPRKQGPVMESAARFTETAARFRIAVETGDRAALADLLADDIRLYSPVKFTPFEDKPLVLGLLDVLLQTFEGFHYVGRFEGNAETNSGGIEVPSQILLFRASVGDIRINGMDLLHFEDETGRINELTVMVRPKSAVHALGEAVLTGLIAAGLAPAPEAAARPAR